ncbi:NADAR family protein [Antrihabitans spumae]|uniref:NADAR family protein n=1 Tax=Antrihabitans spumae TaxID=3373370 RepID=A0ABW7K0E9_9NOCA
MVDPSSDYRELCDAEAEGVQLVMVPFWNAKPSETGVVGPECLSQWYISNFTLDDHNFTSAEQYMMWQKAATFGDEDKAEIILGAKNPSKIKKLGRKVTGFDRDEWTRISVDVVYKANLAKFSQVGALGDYLTSTGKNVLVEASPTDSVWGAGIAADDERLATPSQWPGQNRLGFVLMRVRDELIE